MARPHFLYFIVYGFALAIAAVDARTLYVAPHGNDGTAVADSPEFPYGTLTNAFATLQNGDRLEIAAGTYNIVPGFPNGSYGFPDYAPMKLRNLTNVTVSGNGDVEIYGEGPGDFLMIEFCNNVRIENLTFKGNRPGVPGNPPSLYSTVLLRGVNNGLHFEECRFVGFGNHAISHLFNAKTSFNLVVTNCFFMEGGARDVALLNIDGAAVSGISSGSRIVNNVIDRCYRGLEVEGAYEGTITNVLIEGNIITNSYGAGIMLFATDHLGLKRPATYSDIRILNNVIAEMYPHPESDPYMTWGLQLLGGEKLVVAGNRVKNGRLGMGIEISSLQMPLRNVIIASNVVENVRFRGIQLYNFSSLENATVLSNTVRLVGDEGILMNGKNIHCISNVVEDSARVGERASITLHGDGENGLITDNTVRNSNTNYSDYGIWLLGAKNTLLYGNTSALTPGGAIRDGGTNTTVLAKLLAVERTNSVMALKVAGFPGREYRVEVSPDLTNWTTVTNKTCPESAWFNVEYLAPPVRVNPNAYFRVASVEAGN